MKHKSILKYILMISAATSMMSCNGDLDVMQDNKLSASNMWTTSTDVIQSTYGIYERMRSNFVDGYINVFYWGEARVGNYMWGPSLESRVQDNDMISVRTSTMNASTRSTAWSGLYTTIDQANAVLKYADKVDMTGIRERIRDRPGCVRKGILLLLGSQTVGRRSAEPRAYRVREPAGDLPGARP